MTTPARTGQSRVFIIDGRARPDHQPSYQSSMRMGSPSYGFGDIEAIENPDPDRYDNYIEIGEIRGASERPTTSLEGRYAREIASTLLEIARRKCAVDIQLHWGVCQDPNDFESFDKVLVLENSNITTWSAEDLGALQQSDAAVVNESVDISAKDLFEILPVSFGAKAATIVTTEVIDIKICDVVSCGECEDESDGCYKMFGVTVAAGGSPSTPADVIYSIDKGITWYAHDVESLGAAEDADGIDCIGSYIVVVSNASASQHYALKSEFDGVTDPAFTEVATGYVAGGEPNAIFSIGNMAFIVGDNGYVYKSTDATAGVSVLDAGSATTAKLIDVYAISAEFAVAVGENGAIIYTANGISWSVTTSSPIGFGENFKCVLEKNESDWWVGTNGGQAFYTLDGGVTWTEKAFFGSGTGEVHDIEFTNDSVAWLSHATTAPAGRIHRSYNGGYSWNVMPEGSAALPANDQINALATCMEDANFVVGVGLGDDGSDGYVVVGAD